MRISSNLPLTNQVFWLSFKAKEISQAILRRIHQLINMKSFLSLVLTIVFAMTLPASTEAALGRLRRRSGNPVIQVGLNTVRQIVGPFDRFKLLQRDSEDIVEEDYVPYLEDEDFYLLSMSYDHSMSMSMSMPIQEPTSKDDILEEETNYEDGEDEPLLRGRVGGIFRRKFRGSA